VFINATTRQQISIYSIGPYRYLLACTPTFGKVGVQKNFRSLRSRFLFVPHLKIRGAAHAIDKVSYRDALTKVKSGAGELQRPVGGETTAAAAGPRTATPLPTAVPSTSRQVPRHRLPKAKRELF